MAHGGRRKEKAVAVWREMRQAHCNLPDACLTVYSKVRAPVIEVRETPSAVSRRDSLPPPPRCSPPDLSVYRTTIIQATGLRHGNQCGARRSRGTTHVARVNRARVHSFEIPHSSHVD